VPLTRANPAWSGKRRPGRRTGMMGFPERGWMILFTVTYVPTYRVPLSLVPQYNDRSVILMTPVCRWR